MGEKPIRIAVSACLLGERVRYDGGRRADPYLLHTLGPCVAYLPFCPEAESGLGVPREPARLEGDPASPRMIGRETGRDLTPAVLRWAGEKAAELAARDPWGVILKARSPSCGLRAEVASGNGSHRTAAGLFARRLAEALPLVPVEEDEALWTPAGREHFLTRLFLLKRWRDVRAAGADRAALVDFQSRNKLSLMALDPAGQRVLGRIAAGPLTGRDPERADRYEAALLAALSRRPTRAKHCNVLHLVAGHFKHVLSADEKSEFLGVVEEYRAGLVPLLVPVTLANHWVRRFGQPYLRMQTYLHPDPQELRLRCCV
jgi:uncharacterized protein YbgA (DUF1722 family)/uncharacterized protein YbbK (DUF523 family)